MEWYKPVKWFNFEIRNNICHIRSMTLLTRTNKHFDWHGISVFAFLRHYIVFTLSLMYVMLYHIWISSKCLYFSVKYDKLLWFLCVLQKVWNICGLLLQNLQPNTAAVSKGPETRCADHQGLNKESCLYSDHFPASLISYLYRCLASKPAYLYWVFFPRALESYIDLGMMTPHTLVA